MRYYENVMELLVAQEVEQQMDQLPTKLIMYINRSEVATYALNRLPPLYASSVEGWRQQKQRGEKQLRKEITTAVRQALVAIQRDPIRRSTPIKQTETTQEQEAAQVTLQRLRNLLQDQELSWQNLTYAVERALDKTTPVKVPQQLRTYLREDMCLSNVNRQTARVTQQASKQLQEAGDYWSNSLYLS